MKQQFFTIFIILGLFTQLHDLAKAQDPIYSQYFAAPLQINPAFTGITNAPLINANFRKQWPNLPNAYTTYSVSYSQFFENLNSGFGIHATADDAGDGLYKNNKIALNYSYNIGLSQNFSAKIGIELGLIQSKIDWNRLIFLDQLDPINGLIGSGGIPNITQETPPDDTNINYLDVGVGFLIHNPIWYAGLSIKHLANPDDGFLNINTNIYNGLPLRWSGHAGAILELRKKRNQQSQVYLSPNILYIQQSDFGQVHLGAYMGISVVYFGASYRYAFGNPDALIGLVGFRKDFFKLGYSYDFTISQLSDIVGGTGGTHEISINFNFDESQAVQRKKRLSRHNKCFLLFK